jgi:hypothetical protein
LLWTLEQFDIHVTLPHRAHRLKHIKCLLGASTRQPMGFSLGILQRAVLMGRQMAVRIPNEKEWWGFFSHGVFGVSSGWSIDS